MGILAIGRGDIERVLGVRGVAGVLVAPSMRHSFTLGTTQQSAFGLGSGTSCGGFSTLGRWVASLVAGVACTLLRCAFAFATSFLAIAILVNRLLTFFSASAVSLPAGKLPWSAVASC